MPQPQAGALTTHSPPPLLLSPCTPPPPPPTTTTTTTHPVWLLHSAGLDGLVLTKSIALCIQVFLPIAVVGCGLLMPLQLSEAFEKGDATFSRLTMANVAPGSKIMWAHW